MTRCAFAQPVIRSTEVVNSASYLVQAGSLPLQKSLGGTSVAVTVGGQTVTAYILAASGRPAPPT